MTRSKRRNFFVPEFDLIDRYFASDHYGEQVILGVGDDAAVIHAGRSSHVVISCDTLIEGVHFDRHLTPHAIGWKSLAVSVSDIVAMGAYPHSALLSLGMPAVDPLWVSSFQEGFFACAQAYGVDLIGGDTVRAPSYQLSVTVLGTLFHHPLRRSGASLGDDIWLTGRVGLPALALAHQSHRIELADAVYTQCLAALSYPRPSCVLMSHLAPYLSSAIDISDGFLQDLAHLLSPHERLMAVCSLPLPPADWAPSAVLAQAAYFGGDDYQLLCTAPPMYREAMMRIAETAPVSLQRIGSFVSADSADSFVFLNGQSFSASACYQGFTHFQA